MVPSAGRPQDDRRQEKIKIQGDNSGVNVHAKSTVCGADSRRVLVGPGWPIGWRHFCPGSGFHLWGMLVKF